MTNVEILEEQREIINKNENINSKRKNKECLVMNEVLRDIVLKTIELEYCHVDEMGIEAIIKHNSDYKIYLEKYSQLKEKLFNIIPIEYKKELSIILDEMECKSGCITSIERSYMFKNGVIKGITDLNYLKEVGNQILMI